MSLLRETVLSFFVGGVVLYLYFVAAGAALFGFCGFPRETSYRSYVILKSQRT